MTLSHMGRLVALTTTVIFMFTGCGSQVAPTGGAMIASHAAHKMSGSSGALIYATGGCGGICVVSYPAGKLVDSISVSGELGGDCADSAGNVFVTNNTEVLEYSHGGTSPIATLSLPGDDAAGCSIDPGTGNLAVVFSESGANVAVFPDATGTPTTYESHIVSYYCGYDNAGNLFVSGLNGHQAGLSELPVGKSTFSVLSINGTFDGFGQVQWDGKYVAVEGRNSDDIKVSRLQISGSIASVVGETRFKGKLRNAFQSWIFGNRILIPYSSRGLQVNKISAWAYPKGGKPVIKFGQFGQSKFTKFAGVTLSPDAN
ncbi:MAG: hypothetical protein WA812_11845 [Candidatus Cybelea sp.]